MIGRCSYGLQIIKDHRNISYFVRLAEKYGELDLYNNQGATWFSILAITNFIVFQSYIISPSRQTTKARRDTAAFGSRTAVTTVLLDMSGIALDTNKPFHLFVFERIFEMMGLLGHRLVSL